ncbi:MAG TPA: acyl-CoA thioesterase/BAAT N-terminal domain-containing protein, partial [Burkholderiales bacterium]|nr:acyl-CoA thioesterase/BAAT N-terminal domain-containing protein [Burkholderiales bacterium]
MNQRLGFAALAAIACGVLGAANPAQLTVTPESGLIDAPFHVQLRNVLPGARVTLSASRPDARGRTWTAVGEYAADASGRVDVDLAPSLGGSYEGVSPHGLWCSALPVAPDKLTAYIAELPSHPGMGTAPELEVTGEYRVALSAGVDGKLLAAATAVRSYGPPAATQDVTAAGGVRA